MNNSYEYRCVNYEEIHGLDEVVIEDFFSKIELFEGCKVLDHGCGYGFVTKQLLSRNKFEYCEFYLQDTSWFQIQRAQKDINFEMKYFLGNLKDIDFKDNFFDIIISKIVLQEMPFHRQKEEIEELIRILTARGQLYLWIWWIDDEVISFIRDFVKQKDLLTNLNSFLENRYLPSKRECLKLLKEISVDFEILVERNTNYSLLKQKKGDFKNDTSNFDKFFQWTNSKIEKLSNNQIQILDISREKKDIKFKMPQCLIKILKNEK